MIKDIFVENFVENFVEKFSHFILLQSLSVRWKAGKPVH